MKDEKRDSFGKNHRRPCPYGEANWFSRLTFWWMTPLFRYCYKHPLTQEQLYDVLPEDDSQVLGDRLEKEWKEQISKRKSQNKDPNLFWAVLMTFKWEWGLNGFFLLITEAIRVAQPYLVGEIVDYFQQGSTLTEQEVYILSAIMGACTFLQLLFIPKYFFTAHYIAIKMKVAVSSVIYRKILNMSSSSQQKTTSGKIINHLSTDIEKFNLAVDTFHFAWLAPVEIAILLFLLYLKIGLVSMATLGVIFVLFPLQFVMGWIFGKLRMEIAGRTDKRIHMMNQVIAGMRVIKMYCWEKPFGDIVTKLRKSEMAVMWKAKTLKAFNLAIFQSSTQIIAVIIYSLAWKMNIPMSARLVYSILGWIQCLRITVFLFLVFLIEDNKTLASSLKRIQSFLVLEEMEESPNAVANSESQELEYETSVRINKLTTNWRTNVFHISDNMEKEKLVSEEHDILEPFSLKNIDLDVKQGELIAVVGPVGAGKSSLLMSLLGELPPLEGTIQVKGTLGYVSQTPWVVSGTLQENVLFGQNINKGRYEEVLKACALVKDVQQLKNGDQTLVGERGLLLSGGQKARLTLARTVYRDTDIYLLDDPLSAVDTEVGKHLFQRCICEFLKNKTRILVTHQLQYLKSADRIIAINEGQIIQTGTYSEISEQGTELATFMTVHDRDSGVTTEKYDLKYKDMEKNQDAGLDDEFTETGEVGWGVYKDYISTGRPAVFLPFLITFLFISIAASNFGEWHLARWAESQEAKKHLQNSIQGFTSTSHPFDSTYGYNYEASNLTIALNNSVPIQNSSSQNKGVLKGINNGDIHIQLYMYSFIVYMVFMTVYGIVHFRMGITAGRRLHDSMFQIVLNSKTHFFDSNPVGRILNKFARDMGLMDSLIPGLFYAVVEIGTRLIGLIVVTCIINPWLILPLVPLVIVVYLIRQFSLPTIRSTKRIEAMTQSPVFSHVSDTIIGLQSIRAMGMKGKFLHDFNHLQNQHSIASFMYLSSFRWFSLRSLFCVSVYSNFVIFISLILKSNLNLTGGLIGLALNYVLLLADPFEFFMRQTAELETHMTSVERIISYTRLEQEAAKYSQSPPQSTWPSKGEISLINLGLQYSEDANKVLKDISCSIRSKEKIGIVGRTGAGKSSLLSALLRLAEPTGELFIDGINVLKIGLHELRNKISVIPQDPVLFSGTLRHNLDPFEEYTDQQLWNALEQVQLKAKILSENEGLYMEISEAGQNFSVGQRQLVCLARAILRFNKILVLDEATANVDNKTDELIQETIRDKFQHCTVLTVAHRLHTIMDADRVMVLNRGELVEFDAPYKLLQMKGGYFKNLCDQTGKSQSEHLQKLAEKYHIRRKT